MLRALLIIAVLGAFPAAAQKNPDLEKAQLLLAQKKYPDAIKALEAAEKKGGMDRDSYLTLLESKGLAYASTNKLDKAEEYFRSVLCLDPRRELAGKYAGPVGKPIAAAVEWAKQNGGLELVALDPGVADGRVKQISFAVKNDPLKLVKAVKFYVKQDGGAWKPTSGTVTNGAASLDVDAVAIEWWAETQDLSNNQVAFLASALRPVKNVPPPPPVVAAVEKKADVPKDEPKPEVTPKQPVASVTEPVSSSSSLRTVSYVVAGAGLAAIGVGAYFGLTYNSERTAIKEALMNGSSTQAALYERDQAAIRSGVLANGFLIGGAALVAGGAVMWLLGGDASTQTAVITPLGPGGLGVSGTF